MLYEPTAWNSTSSLVLQVFLGGFPRSRPIGLQPACKPLLAREHPAGFVAQGTDYLVTRFREPRHTMCHAAVFFLVRPFTTPVVNRCATLFPVTHRIPVNRFVRTKMLVGAQAGITPKFGSLVE